MFEEIDAPKLNLHPRCPWIVPNLPLLLQVLRQVVIAFNAQGAVYGVLGGYFDGAGVVGVDVGRTVLFSPYFAVFL